MSKQSERRANGIDLLRTLGGGSYDPARAATAMVRRHGALGTFAVDHVLGNLWSRPQLSRRDRSLIVVTFLTTIGSIEELRSHVGGALHHGVTRSEIEEIVLQVAGYAGYPMAMQASRIVDEVFCAIDRVERQPERGEAKAKDDPARWADATDVLSTLFAGRMPSNPAEARASLVTCARRRRRAGIRLGIRRTVGAQRTVAARSQPRDGCHPRDTGARRRTRGTRAGRAEPWCDARTDRRSDGAAHRLRRLPARGRGHARGARRVRTYRCAQERLRGDEQDGEQ